MDNFEDIYENYDNSPSVIPDAAIIKFRDDTYHCFKFVHEDGKMIGFESEIDKNALMENDALAALDYNQLAFVKIAYEFEYDEEQGVMELELGECITLAGLNDEFVYIEDLYREKPEDLISLYINLLNNI